MTDCLIYIHVYNLDVLTWFYFIIIFSPANNA